MKATLERQEYNRKYYSENREKLLEKQREYYVAHKDKYRAQHKRYYEKHKEELKLRQRKIRHEKYGFKDGSFESFMERQNWRCAGCGADLASITPHADHCHKTGTARGVLCFKCNAALGNVGDSVEILRSLIGYIENHQQLAKEAPEGAKYA